MFALFIKNSVQTESHPNPNRNDYGGEFERWKCQFKLQSPSCYSQSFVLLLRLWRDYVLRFVKYWSLLAGMPRAFSQPCIISFFQPFGCPWRPCHRTRLKVWSMKLLKTTCCTLIYYVKELCCCVTYRAYFGRTSCPCRKSWISLPLSQAIY